MTTYNYFKAMCELVETAENAIDAQQCVMEDQMDIKFKNHYGQLWWEVLPKAQKMAVTEAYKCYDELRDTPLVDDLPDSVVTTIRNDRALYETLRHAHHVFEKEYVLNMALRQIGEGWLEFNEVVIHRLPCQHLCGWLELRELDGLLIRCARAVDLEFERMQKGV